ncbi:MAG: hypothetical protein J7K54_00795 [Candidatus Aenigmarchaeota archaeon]|nr:hypothetical protein [Candidatus Aenigmarchaeota archaeon]
MSKTGIVAAFVLFLMFAQAASAENICDSQRLPFYPSVNSSMILVIPTSEVSSRLSELSGPVSIGWEARDASLYTVRWGSMHKFGDCWICEFSGTDSNFNGNCGATPFMEGGQYNIYFYADDFSHDIEFNRSMLIYTQRMTTGVNVGDDGVVYITADTPTSTEDVWLTLFNADDGEMVTGFDKVNLTQTPFPGRYTFEINSLSTGRYYAVFGFRTTSGEGGGDLAKFEIESQALSLSTDKESYYIGEEIVISGKTTYSQVSASIKTPDGKTESLGTADAINQQYTFVLHSDGTYEEGDYEITATAGGNTAKHTFSLKKLLSVSPLSLTFDIYDTETAVTRNVSIQNLGNDSLSLSSATETLGSYVSTEFGKAALNGLGSTTLSVTINPTSLSESLTGKVIVKAGDTISIPVGVNVNLKTQTGTSQEGEGEIRVTPALWQEDSCIPDSPVSKTFSVQAVGADAGDFDYDASGVDVTDIELPDSVAKGTYGSIDIEVTPSKINEYGQIVVSSSLGTSTIYVSFKCTEDVSNDLTTLTEDLNELKLSYSELFTDNDVGNIFSFINNNIDSATSSLETGDYAAAHEYYQSAKARYETLDSLLEYIKNTAPAGGGEGSPVVTWIIVIIVLAVLGVLGYVAYTKYGSKLLKKGESAPEDEDVDEELY